MTFAFAHRLHHTSCYHTADLSPPRAVSLDSDHETLSSPADGTAGDWLVRAIRADRSREQAPEDEAGDTHGDVITFPTLRFIIPHGGGAVPYHWGRSRGMAADMGGPVTLLTEASHDAHIVAPCD